MQPSYYLEPDQQQLKEFFLTAALTPAQKNKVAQLEVQKINVYEAVNSWELCCLSIQGLEPALVEILSFRLQTEFLLTRVIWKEIATGVQYNEATDYSEPPDMSCDPEAESCAEECGESDPGADSITLDESYLKAYNALYGKKFADGYLYGKHFKATTITPLNELTEARRKVIIQGRVALQRDKDDKLQPYAEREVRGRNNTTRLLIMFNVVDENGGIYVKLFLMTRRKAMRSKAS